jgi:hypothetical protein
VAFGSRPRCGTTLRRSLPAKVRRSLSSPARPLKSGLQNPGSGSVAVSEMSFSAGADDLEVVTEWSQNSWKRADHSHQPAPADDTSQACDLRKRDNRRHERAPESSRLWEFKSHLHRHLGPLTCDYAARRPLWFSALRWHAEPVVSVLVSVSARVVEAGLVHAAHGDEYPLEVHDPIGNERSFAM